jgi:hypothetical protein
MKMVVFGGTALRPGGPGSKSIGADFDPRRVFSNQRPYFTVK